MKYNSQKKNRTSIYLWKLIFIIALVFVTVLSTECFLLIERTVKAFIGGSSEEYSTSMIVEPQEMPAEDNKTDIENKEENNSGENIDTPKTDDNADTNNGDTNANDNTNTVTDTATNTVVGIETTNTITNTSIETNTVSNTVANMVDTNTIGNVIGNTVSTNTVSTNTVDTDKVLDETETKDIILEEKLVCKKIHEHQKICYLEQYTEEDRESIFLVIQMIEELPEFEVISEKLKALEEAEDDEGYLEYYKKITEQIKHIYSYYDALKDEEKDLRSYVTNSDKLLTLYSMCEVDDIDLLTHIVVQYYANIERVKRKNGTIGLDLIDTSADMNGGTPSLPSNEKGSSKATDAGVQKLFIDSNGTIEYEYELTEIYLQDEYDIQGKTGFQTLNRFRKYETDEEYYDLIEIWKLKKRRKSY